MCQNNLITLNLIYALIKINAQDINKVNILFCLDNTFNCCNPTCLEENLKTIVIGSFNYNCVKNFSIKTLKNFAKLGNYDICVKLLSENSGIKYVLIAGNGYMLSKQKLTEFYNAISEFDTLSDCQINSFFIKERLKQNIMPLSYNQFIKRQKEIKNLQEFAN